MAVSTYGANVFAVDERTELRYSYKMMLRNERMYRDRYRDALCAGDGHRADVALRNMHSSIRAQEYLLGQYREAGYGNEIA